MNEVDISTGPPNYYTAMTDTDRRNKLIWRIRGFKAGSSSRGITKEEESNPDFMIGHDLGRKSALEFYENQTNELNVKLSPLRQRLDVLI